MNTSFFTVTGDEMYYNIEWKVWMFQCLSYFLGDFVFSKIKQLKKSTPKTQIEVWGRAVKTTLMCSTQEHISRNMSDINKKQTLLLLLSL